MSHKGFRNLPPLPENRSNWAKFISFLKKYRIIPRSSKPLTSMLRIGTILAYFVLVVCAVYYLDEFGVFSIDKKRFAPILSWKAADNTLIYDRDSNKIGEIFSNYHIYTPYDQLPSGLVKAIIATEDREFFSHRGINLKSMVRAVWVFMSSDRKQFTQGASTITQQLVRHFLLTKEKTISRKLREIILALKLERLISKEKILEIYTNTLFLGDGAYGVGAAAKRYFDKPLSNLELHELALIAGLFQSPSRYNPHRHPKLAKKRQKHVLRSMQASGYIGSKQTRFWMRKALKYHSYRSLYGAKAPYFVDFIREKAKQLLDSNNIKNKGLRIHTTLSPKLQMLTEQAIAKQSELFGKIKKDRTQNKLTGNSNAKLEVAMVVTAPQTGEILAMVGGKNYQQSKFNRAVQAKRQPGSAFKPIVYSLALELGSKWSDVIYVSPITLAGNYRPRSPEADYMTKTTLLRAFYRSMNAPTLELGQKLGMQSVLEHAQKLGVRSSMKAEFGTMLGASELTLLDLARVNGSFANYGVLTELIGITKILDRNGNILYKMQDPQNRSEQVLSPQIAFLTIQGLQQVLMRGTGWKFNRLSKWAAGKTGTSNESKDNWFTGFTDSLVAVTWVGSDDSSPIYGNTQGGTVALPIWADFIENAQKFYPSEPFKVPEGVKDLRINAKSGVPSKEGMKMWFLEEALPKESNTPITEFSTTKNFRNPIFQ
ncbi:MAG: transglycosylase domain-containing protein [Oligoflexales bacterium]